MPQHWHDNRSLGKWVMTQRQQYKKGKLAAERIALLRALGFDWDPQETKWREMFRLLEAYKAEHSDCLVPQDWSENQALAWWVKEQRYRFSNGKLEENRVALLQALGFDWDPPASRWAEMLRALETYKEAHGNCLVPEWWPHDPQLSRWVDHQRQLHRKGELAEERSARLEALGFDWDPQETKWQQMFCTLRAYKEEHGDCMVPQRWRGNPQLGRWVDNQRKQYHRGKMAEERVRRLKELGFAWRGI